MAQPPGGVNLGSAFATITLNDNMDAAIGRATQKFDNALTAIGGKMQRLGRKMSNVGSQLTLATAPLAAVGLSGIRAAGSFQDALTEIQARAGLTEEALDEVRTTALRLGADTKFSTQQAADAFLQLLTAGLDTEQALAALPAILDGAAAAGADLGTAADLVTNIMSSFGLQASETEAIVNALSQAAASSPASMIEMGVAMQDAGAVARQYGLDLEETAAIMAIFAQRGIRGSEAATQLRMIMGAMTANTEKASTAWAMVGTRLFDAEGNMRDFDTVLSEIRIGMQGLNDEQRAFVMQTLAGQRGQMGLSALLGSEGIGAMTELMNEQATAAEVAEARMNTFQGKITSLKGSIEALLITAFTPFIEMLTPMVEKAIEVVNSITAWIDAYQDIAQSVLKVLSVLIVLGPALIILGQVVMFIGGAVSGLGILFGVLTGPIGLVIVAIGLLAAAWITDFNNMRFWTQAAFTVIHDLIVFKVLPVFQLISRAVQNALHVFRLFSDDGRDLVKGLGLAFVVFANTLGLPLAKAIALRDGIAGALKPIHDLIVFKVLPVFQLISRAVQNALHVFRLFSDDGRGLLERLGLAFVVFANTLGIPLAQANAMRDGIVDALKTIVNSVSDTVSRIINATTPIFRELQLLFSHLFGDMGSKELFKFAGMVVKIGRTLLKLTHPLGQISLLLDTLFGIDLFEVAISGFERLAAIVAQFFQGLNLGLDPLTALQFALGNPQWLQTFLGVFQSVIDFVTGTAIPAVQRLTDWLGNIWLQAQPHLQAVGAWFLNVGGQIANIITGRLIPILRSVIQWLRGLWEIAAPHLQALANWFLTTAVPAIANFITNTLLPVIDTLLGWLQRLWTDVSPFLTRLFDWFMNTALPPIINFITTQVWPTFQELIGLFQDIWRLVSPFLTKLYNWFITDALPAIMAFIEGPVTLVWDTFILLLSGIWAAVRAGIVALRDNLETIFNWIIDNVIQPMIDKVQGFIDRVSDLAEAAKGAVAGAQQDIDAMQQALDEGGLQGAVELGVQNLVVLGQQVFGADSGRRGMPGMPVLIGAGAQPELFIPDSPGTFIPNADQLMGGGGVNINGPITIQANSYAEGAAAARGFRDEFEELMRMT